MAVSDTLDQAIKDIVEYQTKGMIARIGEPGLELVLAVMRAEQWRRDSCDDEHDVRFHVRVMAAFAVYQRETSVTADALAAIRPGAR